jgi:hypothetical protein
MTLTDRRKPAGATIRYGKKNRARPARYSRPAGTARPAWGTGAALGSSCHTELRGERGLTGATGARGKIGARGLIGKAAPPVRKKLIEEVNDNIEDIYRELNVQMTRMAQIQQQVDELRDKIRKLAE